MRCDEVQRSLSERFDGVATDTGLLDRHVDGCPDCQAFLMGAGRVRRELRLSPLDDGIPDITAAVLERLPESRSRTGTSRRVWRAAIQLAASLVVGVVVGALLADASGREPTLAEELGDRVLAAQHTVSAFDAEITIEEHGWHPQVPVRRYEGSLRYAAPEQLFIELRDRTPYPDAAWVPNHVTRVVTRAAEWSTAVAPCPLARLPGCLPDAPRTTGVTDRVPLSGLGAQALDAVVPVHSLHLGGGTDLGSRATADGEQVGVSADVAQLDPLLDALLGAGTWRELHPSDSVELWVDATSLTPRELTVRAAAGRVRAQWAVERGLLEGPGDVLLTIRLQPRERTREVAQPSTPPELRSAAFVDGEVDLPLPETLPEGMQLYRSGTQVTGEHDVATAAWTDGRAWLRLRSVDGWSGRRLFGDLGSVVRRVTLPDGRIVYVSGGGQTAAIHADGLDLVIEGSIGREALIDVAASIPVDGQRVPRGWAEAADSSLREATTELPGLLVPAQLEGFGPPAVRVGDGQVVIGYAGSGGRELVLTQRAGDAVAPPVVADVLGVEVRGRPGRYLPAGAELEWVEGGIVVSLQSEDLSLAELLRIAAGLEVAP